MRLYDWTRPASRPKSWHETCNRAVSTSYNVVMNNGSDHRGDKDHVKHEREYSPTKRYTAIPMQEEEEGRKEAGQESLVGGEQSFGRLSDRFQSKYNPLGTDVIEELEEAEVGEEWVRSKVKRNTPIWYGNQMKKLIKEGKLAEAIEILEVTMLKEARVTPTEINYNILLGGCGRAGYTEKAFDLYNRMKERGLEPSTATYTALFNACSESPWKKTDGLTRLRKLHRQLIDKTAKVNLITHHAMMKAYAKCGDLEMTFKLFRHLLDSGVQLMPKSFSFLLFACADDKEAGFLYAIEAWRQMQAQGIQPNIFTYNLVLRAARDCSLGDPQVANRVLLRTVTPRLTNPSLMEGRVRKDVWRKRDGRQRGRKAATVVPLSGKKLEMVTIEPLQLDEEFDDGFDGDMTLELPSFDDEGVNPVADDRVRLHVGGAGDRRDTIRQERGSLNMDGPSHSLPASADGNWWETSDSSTNVDAHSKMHTLRESSTETSVSVPSQNIIQLRKASRANPECLPNLLDINSDFSNVQSLAVIGKPSDRLALLGGADGFLGSMTANDVKPDVKCLSLLAEILPGKKQEENQLLQYVKEHKVKVDIDFYNVFIRRRTRRGDLKSAKAMLSHISDSKIYPNLRTYVNLATGCGQQEEGFRLLKEMEEVGIDPTCHLYGALIGSSQKHRNFRYLVDILKHMEAKGVLPNERVITQLEKIASFGQDKLAKSQRTTRPISRTELNMFRGFYNQWLSRMKVETSQHPWAKFRKTDKGNMDYKFHETAI